MFEKLENDPNYEFCANDTELANLFNNIKSLYMINTRYNDDRRPIEELSNSLVYENGEWVKTGGSYHESMNNYNCYSFAIDRLDKFSYYSADIPSLSIGQLSNILEFNYHQNPISIVLDQIVSDLESLNLKNVTYYDSMPNDLSGKELICFRRGYLDYHFMKYDKNSKEWYHKPGNSAILKYIGTFDNDIRWDLEYSINGYIFTNEITYDSDIYYFTYETNNIDLNCYSDYHVNDVLELNDNNKTFDKVYDLRVNCDKTYDILLSSNHNFKIVLFDCIGRIIREEIAIYDNSEYVIDFDYYFTTGIYYMQFVPIDTSLIHNVSVNIKPKFISYGQQVYIENNDVTTHLHPIDGQYLYTKVKFTNISEAGFFEFVLTGTDTNLDSINPYLGSLKIYENSLMTSIAKKHSTSINSLDAIGTDKLLIYIPSNTSVYIWIELPIAQYENVNLLINSIEQLDINVMNSMTSGTIVELFSTNSTQDLLTKVMITHKSLFIFDSILSANSQYEFQFVIYKEEKNELTNKQYLVNVLSETTDSFTLRYSYSIILQKGIYYLGFIGKKDSSVITSSLERIVDTNINIFNTLVADPYSEGYELGTEVKFNNGLIDNYIITEGFTRNIYLMVEDRLLQPISRLDYDWYSSDDNIATVTSFGTVLAKPVDTDTYVKIYAVLKTNPSIVYEKTFLVLNDLETTPITISCNLSYSYSSENGSYKIALNSNNSPYPMVQYYSWCIEIPEQENNLTVHINNWGIITASNTGYAIIRGTYLFNPRVTLIINLSINN